MRDVTGVPDVPDVPDVIAARLSGVRDDHVLALTVEGGGMRGVVSGAMLIALRDRGVLAAFDRVYGISSGALNLAYLASGRSWDALAIYYDRLVDGFVRRAPRPGRPLLAMERVEQVLRSQVPLDVVAARHSPLDLRLVLSDVVDCRPVIVPARDTGDRLVEHLVAGAWMPVLAGAPYRIGGRAYLDGGLLWPDPLYAALEQGATHVLMLSSSAEGGPLSLTGPTSRFLPPVLDRWSPGLGTAFREGNRRWAADNARLPRGRSVYRDGVLVHRVRPAAGAHAVGRLTRDRATLLDGARCGYTTAAAAFGAGPDGGGYFSVVGG